MTPTTCIPDAYTSSSVCLAPPSSDVNPDVTATTVAPREPNPALAFTGGDVLALGVIGGLALIGGAVVVAANHRRSRWNVPRAGAERNPWRVS